MASAAYTEEFLVDKLSKLVNTQESIQTLSEWVKFHKKKCKQSVDVWDRELYNAPRERKLVFLYLANDIMQTSRKKGGEFIQEFARVLPRAVQHVYRECDKDDKKTVNRLLNIWRDRRVLPSEYIDGIAKGLMGQVPAEQIVVNVPAELDAPPITSPSKTDPVSTLMRELAGKEIEMALAEEKVQSIRPQLMSGEAIVSCVNQSEVTELAFELDEAINVLAGFQKSLEEDSKSRTKLVEALKSYLESQQQQEESTQKKIQVYKQELIKTEALKQQLKILYEKLPSDDDNPPQPPDERSPPLQKRDYYLVSDVLSPGKRVKTDSLPSNNPSQLPNQLQHLPRTLNPPSNTILANQSYYAPPSTSDHYNSYPLSNNIHNLHNMPVPIPVPVPLPLPLPLPISIPGLNNTNIHSPPINPSLANLNPHANLHNHNHNHNTHLHNNHNHNSNSPHLPPNLPPTLAHIHNPNTINIPGLDSHNQHPPYSNNYMGNNVEQYSQPSFSQFGFLKPVQ